ncbi:hypothetical protein [Streptomyces sp. 6N106]
MAAQGLDVRGLADRVRLAADVTEVHKQIAVLSALRPRTTEENPR